MATAAARQIEKDTFLDEMNRRIAALNVGQIFLADYISCGSAPHIKQPELSKILSGYRPHDSTRAKQIEDAVEELEWVFNWYFPWQPPLNDARRLRNFIAAVREFKEEVSRARLRQMWESAA
jgi:hypothetical protein